LVLSGVNPDHIISSQTLHGKLIFFHNKWAGYGERFANYPGHIPMSPQGAMGAFRKIFNDCWHLGPDLLQALGVRIDYHETIDFQEWYWRVYKSFAKIDFRVKRMLEIHRRTHPDTAESLAQLRVGCFAKPAGLFSTWQRCLQPLADSEWPTRSE